VRPIERWPSPKNTKYIPLYIEGALCILVLSVCMLVILPGILSTSLDHQSLTARQRRPERADKAIKLSLKLVLSQMRRPLRRVSVHQDMTPLGSRSSSLVFCFTQHGAHQLCLPPTYKILCSSQIVLLDGTSFLLSLSDQALLYKKARKVCKL
jgi:hypothetical protein